MQSTTSPKPIEFWWPSPEAFDELIVEDTEGGFTLEAPDDSECGEWLGFWNQSEERHALFEKEFINTLLNYLKDIDGQTEGITDHEPEDRA